MVNLVEGFQSGSTHSAARMPKEELKSRLRLDAKAFNALLAFAVHQGVLVEGDGIVRRPDFQVRFTPQQQRQIDQMLAEFRAQPYAPPPIPELEKTPRARASPGLLRTRPADEAQ